jgi:hypothetical protein
MEVEEIREAADDQVFLDRAEALVAAGLSE